MHILNLKTAISGPVFFMSLITSGCEAKNIKIQGLLERSTSESNYWNWSQNYRETPWLM